MQRNHLLALLLFFGPAVANAMESAQRVCFELMEIMGKFGRPLTEEDLAARAQQAAETVTQFANELRVYSGTGDSDRAAQVFRPIAQGKTWFYQIGSADSGSASFPSDAVLRRMERVLAASPGLTSSKVTSFVSHEARPLAREADGQATASATPPMPTNSVATRPRPTPDTRSVQLTRRAVLVSWIGTWAAAGAVTAAGTYGVVRGYEKRYAQLDAYLLANIEALRNECDGLSVDAFRATLQADLNRATYGSAAPFRYPYRYMNLAGEANFAPARIAALYDEYRLGVRALTLAQARQEWYETNLPGAESYFIRFRDEWTAAKKKRADEVPDYYFPPVMAAAVADAGLSIAYQAGVSERFYRLLHRWGYGSPPPAALPLFPLPVGPPIAAAKTPALKVPDLPDPHLDPAGYLLHRAVYTRRTPFVPIRWYFVGANEEATGLHTDFILKVDYRLDSPRIVLVGLRYHEKESNYWPPGGSIREQFANTADAATATPPPLTPEAIRREMAGLRGGFEKRHPDRTTPEFIPFANLWQRFLDLKISPQELAEVRTTLAISNVDELAPLLALYDKLAARRPVPSISP